MHSTLLLTKFLGLIINFGMRIFSLMLLCLLSSACTTTREPAESPIEIVEITPRYIEAETFKRISEYMTGRENSGRRVIIRTNPKQRSGYYFVLILDRNVRRLPSDAYLIGEFYTSKSRDVQTHQFQFPSIPPSTREVFIGLTGDDQPPEGEIPTAWRFTIKNSQEAILAQKKSYLWSL